MIVIPRSEVILCDTDEARDLHYRVRYKVFCEQTGFEKADAFPDGRERDEHDVDAVHFLVGDRLTGRWTGAMRLIPASRRRLPMEDICGRPVDGLDNTRFRAVELSRLSVVSDARWDHALAFPSLPTSRASVESHAAGPLLNQERHEIVVRMVWATIQWAKAEGMDDVYGIVTAALARMLRNLGVPAVPVGVEVRHRGLRRPYRYPVHETAQSMVEALPNAAHIFHDEQPFVPFSDLIEACRQVA